MVSPSAPYEQFTFFRTTFPALFVAHVETNRPGKLNAFNHEMFHEIRQVFNLLSYDPNVRVIVYSGAGPRGFCAGLDVEESSSTGPVGAPNTDRDFPRQSWDVRRHALSYQESVTSLERCEKPIICLMHGVAFGAGINFATAADVRYATRDMKLCLQEINVGLAPDVGALSRMPKLGVSYSWTKEVIYAGKVVGGDEALRVGLVSRVFDTKQEMVEAALSWAKEVATKSPVAVQSAKALWDFSRDRPVADGLLYTAAWNGTMVLSDDTKKGITSALKKRKPTFEKL
ncbi:hypothetical protein VHEMI09881 [[Torrubiella] hemipterigena]|uniref:Enoyl-CoA hydratase n=1 Tax=[Torrubiella] hemipterigena TaxID=1531966 RepID=A0A0A1TR49_9HYPO|nr:hypothetical protein VHEMI09881 [[Torrubiella] hemipterigena]